MADERFKGLWVPIPFIAITMLIIFILQLIIRLWMINAPTWERKCVRHPVDIKYGLPDPPERATLYGRPPETNYAYTNKAYTGYHSAPTYHRSGYSSPGFSAAVGEYRGHYQPAKAQARQYYM